MRTKKHSPTSLMLFAILFATVGVVGKAKAIASSGEFGGEVNTDTSRQSKDPACANAVPLNELRPVPIVAQGDFEGCVDKSKLLCSLERQDLDNLDNVMRYTVAKMPDGKCIRVNLVNATMFKLGVGKGTTEFRAVNYLNPTKPFPAGYFIFGAMPNKRTLYVHTKVDHCEQAQGGELVQCKADRDLRTAQAQELCKQQGRIWDDKAKDGEECLISISQLAQTTPRSNTTATPGPSPDRATATTATAATAPSAPGPSPETTRRQRTEDRAQTSTSNWLLAPLLILTIAFFILWLNERHDRKRYHKENLALLNVSTTTKQLQDGYDTALRTANTTITQLQGDLNTANAEIKKLETDVSAARKDGDHSNCVPRSAHTDCMSRADHDTACSTLEEQHQRALQAADQRNVELKEQLTAEKRMTVDLKAHREEIERLLPSAKAGIEYLTAHSNTKVRSKKGLKNYGAIKDLIESISRTPQPIATQID